ncbi:hypothetical protein PC115_g8037 [Phytophthora cactorum]|uniref:Uncharacterized protein n=1 Tax=Phytophthora cactorum TaxID=29920 RepID=A0A8T1CQH8_9STRA|nr:hypothetical protein PC115_g8037 [Phytophthora cactorum]
MALDGDGLDAFSTPAGSTTRMPHPATQSARSVGLSKPIRTASSLAGNRSNPTKRVSATKKQKTEKPAAREFKPGSRDEEWVMPYDTLLEYSNRLGGLESFLF